MRIPKRPILLILISLISFSLSCNDLSDAIRNYQSRYAIELIEGGADVNGTNGKFTMLQLAIDCKMSDVALSLIENGANVNSKGQINLFPLEMAINANMDSVALSLVEHGASSTITRLGKSINNGLESTAIAMISRIRDFDPDSIYDAPYRGKYTLLEFSISNSLPNVALTLIEKGANPNLSYYYNTPPLYRALLNGFSDVALSLVEHGADPNYYYQEYDGVKTVLYMAISKKMPDVVLALLAKGADVNETAPDGTPLVNLAYRNGMYDAVSEMVGKGAKLGITLRQVIQEGHLDVAFAQFNASANTIKTQSNVSLIQAAMKQDRTDILKKLLSDGLEEDKDALLFTAIDGRYQAAAKVLLESGANPNAKNSKGISALNHAINTSPSIATLILAGGADSNAADSTGYTPIGLAVEKNIMSLILKLHTSGADMNAICDSNGNTPLTLAIRSQKTNIIEALLGNGADPDAKDRNGNTPLYYAVKGNMSEITDVLIEAEADIRKLPDTALPYAVRYGMEDISYELISSAKNINAADEEGNTALYYAVKLDSAELVSELIRAKAKPSKGKHNPLSLAISRGYEDIAQILIDAGTDFNALDENGDTPLTLSVGFDKIEIARSLIEKGADINQKDSKGFAPISIAIINQDYDMAQMLIAAGATTNRQLLYTAISNGLTDIALAMINQGINLEDDYSGSLSYAISHSMEEIASALVEAGVCLDDSLLIPAIKNGMNSLAITSIETGADPNATDSKGNTPLYYALVNHMQDVAIALLKAGAVPNEGKLESNLIYAIKNDLDTVIIALIAAGADVNYEEYRYGIYKSVMCYAAERYGLDVIQALYNYGAEPNYILADRDSFPPVYYAICADNKEGVSSLVSVGAELNHKTIGKNAAYIAVTYSDDPDMIKLLHDLGCSFGWAAEDDGKTPLIYAINSDRPLDIIKAVISCDVDVNAKDKDGRSALIHAAMSSSPAVIAALLDAGADPMAEDNRGNSVFDYIRQNRRAAGSDAYMRILKHYRPGFKEITELPEIEGTANDGGMGMDS